MTEIDGLTKYFLRGTINEVAALRALGLTIEDGDFITIIGSNGAGKSTFLKALAGVVIPEDGSIRIDGVDVARAPAHRRAHFIGRVDQDPMGSTASMMSIEENLAMAIMRGRGRWLRRAVTRERRAHFRELLGELGMGLESRLTASVGTLSGGQRQALALLMATLGEPRLLLLDEHTAGLDPRSARQVMEITNRIITDHHLTALMVTHNMEQAIHWGNRLIMMNRGQIVLDIVEPEKHALQVSDLIAKFSQVSGEAFDDDRLLLATSRDET